MSRLPLRKPAPLRRANSRFAIVVLLVIAAGVLLAVPATASAHIDSQHREVYLANLHNWGLYHDDFKEQVEVYATAVGGLADEEQPLIGSAEPTDVATLHDLESQAGDLWQVYLSGSMTLSEHAFAHDVKVFYRSTESWCDKGADRIKLLRGTKQVSDSIGRSISWLKHAALAAQYLTQADVGDARQQLAKGKTCEATAEKWYTAGMKSLYSIA
jgi:hypothetical protein